jgi:hypothetical protein
MKSKLALCFVLLALGACGSRDAVESAVPVEAVSRSIGAAAAPTASTPASASTSDPAQQVLGKWCMRSMTISGTDRTTLDGSSWDLRQDGTYRYESELIQGGHWSLAPGKLSMTKIGDHEIVELSAERMVLRRMGVDQHFHRDCGPELERARRAASLRKAASKGDYIMVKALLDQGNDVNAIDRLEMKERTPLLAAVEGGHCDLIKPLLARGADVTIVDMPGSTVFEHARKRCAEAMPLLFAKLPLPGSPDLPVFKKQADNNLCPLDYLSMSLVCVHASSLARPVLNDEAQEFFMKGTTPNVGSNPVELPAAAPPPPVEEEIATKKINYAQDPSLLDPAALMNPDGDRPRPVAAVDTQAQAAPKPAPPKKETPGARRRREAEEEQMAMFGKALGGLIAVAEQAARDPKYQGREGGKKFGEDFKQVWCETSKQAVDNARAGNNGQFAEALGISKQEHARKLEEKHRSECQ